MDMSRHSMGPFKLLHLPNGSDDVISRQSGPRDAFEKLHQEGVLSAYEVSLFLAEFRRSRDAAAVQKEILRCAKAMRPDIIFWQHISEFPVDRKFFHDLRDASQGALLAYHEGDAFDRCVKRISPSLRTAMSSADIVFTVALGKLAQLMRKNGAKDLRYLPHSYDKRRFGKPWDFSDRREYKVAMIANSGRRRIPGLYMPGGRQRACLAQRLATAHGADFALYGRSWPEFASLRGPLAFDRQEQAIRNSWVSVNWDHFDDLAYYFSDRLPISLVAGVPHVTTYHEGYEDMFSGCPGLYTARSVDEAVAKVDWVLSHSRKQLVEIGQATYEWVKERFDADNIYRHAILLCAEKMR